MDQRDFRKYFAENYVHVHCFRAYGDGALFGGAVVFSKDHFVTVNGYSNLYFDWGAEDDDLMGRSDVLFFQLFDQTSIPRHYITATQLDVVNESDVKQHHFRISHDLFSNNHNRIHITSF